MADPREIEAIKQNEQILLPTQIIETNGTEYAELCETAADSSAEDACNLETDPMADVEAAQINMLDGDYFASERTANINHVNVEDNGSQLDVLSAAVVDDVKDVKKINENVLEKTKLDTLAHVNDAATDAANEAQQEQENLTDNVEKITENHASEHETTAETIEDEENDAEEDEDGNDEDGNDEDADESSAAIQTEPQRGARKEETVDEHQCRVCQSKEDLVGLFDKIDANTPADMLMTICPSLSIALQDFMPQFICNNCLDSATIAIQLKNQLETTERELRKKLSRSKNKVRRPKGYIVIDAPDSEPPSEEEPNDDVEFKVSDVEVASSIDSDSDDSDYSDKRKRAPRSIGTGRRGRRKVSGMSGVSTTSSTKSSTKRQAAAATVSYETESDDEEFSPQKRRCTNTQQTELICEYCNKKFKIKRAYQTHLAKHYEDKSYFNCAKCSAIFKIRSEMLRHMADEHGEADLLYECNKCRRTFVSEARLQRHKNGYCPGGGDAKAKKNDYLTIGLGKDLFKSVAPLTTTYWSDSFSD